MKNILTRFSSRIKTQSLMIINTVMNITDYERQLTHYEECVYGRFTGNGIIKILSQREKLLLLHKQTLLERLLAGARILSNLLDSLQIFREILEKEYNRQRWWESVLGHRAGDSTPYKIALDKMERAQEDLIKEASVLAVVMSSIFKDWYDKTLSLDLSDIQGHTHKRYKDVHFFFEVSQVMVSLNMACQAKCTQLQEEIDVTSQVDVLSVDKAVEVPRKRLSLSDYVSQQMLKVENNIRALGLSSEQLATVNKKRHSFWKSDRYQAELVFLQVDAERAWKSVDIKDYQGQWNVMQAIADKVNVHLCHLNVFFHRKTRRLYHDFRQGCLEKRSRIAREGLSAFLEKGDVLADRQSPVKAWLASLSPQLIHHWEIIEAGLQHPEHIQALIWKKALSALCDFLRVGFALKSTVFRRLVLQYFVPAVKHADRNVQHPAYRLIYQYAPSEAYDIMKPQFKDIWMHLRDDRAWEDVGTASRHLLFLMNPDAFNVERVCVVKMIFFKALFSGEVNRVHWDRLAALKNTQDVLDESKELQDILDDCQALYIEQATEEVSLQDMILAHMSVESVLALQVNQEAWRYRLLQWGKFIDLLSEAFLEVTHDYHVQARSLFGKIAEHLLMLSHDFYIIRTAYFKQLLEFCQQQVFLDAGLRGALNERLINWSISDFPEDALRRSCASRPIETAEESSLMPRVLQDLSVTMQKLYNISRTNQSELKGLFENSLTRLELNALSRESAMLAHHEDKVRIIRLLDSINLTRHASVFCKRQAYLLKRLLSCEVPEEKPELIEQYLDVISHQEQTVLGMFAGQEGVVRSDQLEVAILGHRQ